MLRQNAKILTVAKVVADILCILVAFFASWYFKFVLQTDPATEHLPISAYLELLWLSLPTFLILYSAFGLYKPQRIRSAFRELYILFLSGLCLFAAISIYLFVFKIYHISRILVGLFCASAFLLSAFCRMAQRILTRTLRKKGFNIKYIVLIGLTGQGKTYLDSILRRKSLGYVPLGFMDATTKKYKEIPYLGDGSDLSSFLENNIVDEVVLALPLEQYGKLPDLIEICEKNGVKSVIIPAYTEFLPAKPQIDEIDDIPLVNTRYIPLDNLFFSTIKRLADILLSALLMLVLSPLFLVLALLIKCTSKGSVFFSQERVGYNKKTFKIYKFRTMRPGQAGGWTVENDPRVTPLGKFLRKTSLDELPQLYNVFKGEMSLVGPRPEQTAYVEQFKETIPKYMLKHRVRPGITGWAQVNGLRGDTSIEERIKHDIYYIENWSFLLDIKILILTLFKHRGY
ncbi:MAG: undecaprenyl-phosphate glucose phosphotransferase [Clostridia bacterium]|nr:undecaprenyl-phosphate glucose phosphotransferase [Clostridia bacterium]